MDDLNDIPEDQTTAFPDGVSEVEYDTTAEMRAFLDGFNYAEDIDTEAGEPFGRNGKWVVRVKVGDF